MFNEESLSTWTCVSMIGYIEISMYIYACIIDKEMKVVKLTILKKWFI